jgi:predicted transcriptional regulator
MHKTTLYLPVETQRRLRDLAARTGRPQAEIVRQALDRYLASEPSARPRSLGAGEDTGLDGRDSEHWLRTRWQDG